jgi:hypothetical protein
MNQLIRLLKQLLTQRGRKPSKIGTPDEIVIQLRKDLAVANERLSLFKRFGSNIRAWPTKELIVEVGKRVRKWFKKFY